MSLEAKLANNILEDIRVGRPLSNDAEIQMRALCLIVVHLDLLRKSIDKLGREIE